VAVPEWNLGCHALSCVPRRAQAKPLRGFDEEVRDFAMDQYQVRGLSLHPLASPTRVVKGPDGKLTLHADVKGGEPLVLEVRSTSPLHPGLTFVFYILFLFCALPVCVGLLGGF